MHRPSVSHPSGGRLPRELPVSRSCPRHHGSQGQSVDSSHHAGGFLGHLMAPWHTPLTPHGVQGLEDKPSILFTLPKRQFWACPTAPQRVTENGPSCHSTSPPTLPSLSPPSQDRPQINLLHPNPCQRLAWQGEPKMRRLLPGLGLVQNDFTPVSPRTEFPVGVSSSSGKAYPPQPVCAPQTKGQL